MNDVPGPSTARGDDRPDGETEALWQPGDTVLDLGGGMGTGLLSAACRVGPTGRVVGVDTTDETIEAVRADVAAAGLENVEIRKGAMEHLPVADESIDWVVSNCAINRSQDERVVFAEITRVLKQGGRLRITDVVVDDRPEWVRHDERLHGSWVAEAVGEGRYVEGLRDAGLVDLSVGGRYVHDRDELAAMVAGLGLSSIEASRAAEALVGRVWLVHVTATKAFSEHQET